MVESVDTGHSALANALDIEQIPLEAQHRWFRPDEICEIIQNYKKFGITPEPLNQPPSTIPQLKLALAIIPFAR
ncbi:hypothetical protein SLEP1_g56554 [Rubroshorea leprosula]|uniref:CG-1 domain-containing protein n=1 Tax=Rubroshorea leprosula TaxID=152421 RepID=A0AAV5MIM9_9ROSI|nr:hypothetical protein SLEP1_g56554 [Rubroshorea leprosula]